MVNYIIDIGNTLYYINNGYLSTNYYTTLGITTVTTENVAVISKNVVAAKNVKGSNLTKAEIKKVVEDSLKLKANLVQNAVIAKEEVIVTNNLTEIQQVSDDKTKDVLKEENKDNQTLEKINAGQATLDDYELIGVTGVTDKNLEYINKDIEVAKDAKGSNLTKLEIKESVDESLKKIAELEESSNLKKSAEEITELKKNDDIKQEVPLKEIQVTTDEQIQKVS